MSKLMAHLDEWRAARQAIFDVPLPQKDKRTGEWVVPPTDMVPLFLRLSNAEHVLMADAKAARSFFERIDYYVREARPAP